LVRKSSRISSSNAGIRRSIFTNWDGADEKVEGVAVLDVDVDVEGTGETRGRDGIGTCCLPLMSATAAARSAARFQPSNTSRSKRRTSLSISFAHLAQSHIPFEESHRCSGDRSS
jgi:hypothetical protein